MWQQELVNELSEAVNGEKDVVMAKYAAMSGYSVQSLYRIAREHGYVSGRGVRKDKGRVCLTDEQVEFVGALIHTSAREVKGTIMDVDTALSIAIDNGVIDNGAVSVSRLRGILREREMGCAALNTPDPHIHMRSLHPNHVHVFDASVCIQYYLRRGTGLRIMDERKFYKNKPDNFGKIKRKLIRYVLADHFSHTIWVKYYLARGENQADAYDFLVSAWRGDKHDRFPFRGVPNFLLMDAGSANVSKAMLGFLGRLGIEYPKSMPHNPKRQGSAEVTQNIVESKFESRLRFQPAHTVEDLNAWALDWCVWFNGEKKHTRHGMTRTECWLKITSAQLRELPSDEILQNLFANPEVTRTVSGSYSVSFMGETYDVRHVEGLIPHKSKVMVVMCPFLWPEVTVKFNDVHYQVKPIGKVEGGFRADAAVIGEEFKSKPESVAQKAKKRMDNLAYGEERVKNAPAFEGITAMGIHADKVRREYLPKQGEAVTLTASCELEERRVPVATVIRRLVERTGSVTPEVNVAIREAYGASMSLRDVDRLMEIATAQGELHLGDIAPVDDGEDVGRAVG